MSSEANAPDLQRTLPHNPALDGLRGLAILLVVFHHCGFKLLPESLGSSLVSNVKAVGWVGVDLFFVLSGFLITAILLRSYGRVNWVRNFIVRRALRVLPLYLLVIFFCFNVVVLLPIPALDWLRDLSQDQLWYWLHLANFRKMASDIDPTAPTVGWFSTYWSLSIEEHFYLVWPFVLMLVGPKRLGWVAMAVIPMVWGLRSWIAATDLPNSFIYNNTLTRIDGLLLGSLIAWAQMHQATRLLSLKPYLPLAAVILTGLFVVPMAYGFTGGGRDTLYGRNALYTASVLLSGIVVWYLATQSNSHFIPRLFHNRVLISFGTYSYAIYVFNKPILYGLAAVINPTFDKLPAWAYLPVVGLSCLACWAVAWVSWRCIESPMLSLKKYFPTRAKLDAMPNAASLLISSPRTV